MAEPHVISGVVIGTTISPVVILLGAQVDALVAGLMAAVFVSFWLPTVDTKPKAAAGILLSSMLAGYGSPVAASYLVGIAPDIAAAGDVLRLLCSFVIGAFGPWALPLIVQYAKTKTGGAT